MAGNKYLSNNAGTITEVAASQSSAGTAAHHIRHDCRVRSGGQPLDVSSFNAAAAALK